MNDNPCIKNKYDIIATRHYDITLENDITNEVIDITKVTIDTIYTIDNNRSHIITVISDNYINSKMFSRIKSNINHYSLTIWSRPINTNIRTPILKYINLNLEVYQCPDQKTLRMHTNTVKYFND